MKVRLIIAARAIAGAMLLTVTVAACTGGSPSSSAPSIFTPQPDTQSPSAPASSPARTPTVGTAPATATSSAHATSSARATGKASGKASGQATPTPRPSATATRKATPKATPTSHRPSPAHTPVPVASPYPTSAPETGGGGTAGLQDGLLFGIGGGAILAGLGSLGYRRRLRRRHRASLPATRTDDTPTRTGIR